MSKTLVIVESPAKAKTISKYLGSDYVVKSSVGHIRDLPKGKSKKPTQRNTIPKDLPEDEKRLLRAANKRNALIRKMGVDPDKNWEIVWQVSEEKAKVVKELKAAAKKVDSVFLATDLDREGEAIAWHLKETLGPKKYDYSRIRFNQITKDAITQAINDPKEIDLNLVEAYQARRALDRVVGYELSPLLWEKIARSLSAGRVQSVALRLLVEREHEIQKFKPEEFWEISFTAKQESDDLEISFSLNRSKNSPLLGSEEAKKIETLIQDNQLSINEISQKPVKVKPKAPFITSTLQQAASTKLGFNVKRTMRVAQNLYAAGFITYMRTDAPALSKESIADARMYISSNYGDKYLTNAPRIYSSNENAQEAHEAIRPTNASTLAALLPSSKEIKEDEKRLYDLIWQQFISSQLPDAEYLATNAKIKLDEYIFSASGREVIFDGYTKALNSKKDEQSSPILPNLTQGQKLNLQGIENKQKYTKPPSRFSEAALVKELEKKGIGRPSTYASIISTIQDRGYVDIENRRFFVKKIGMIVSDRLVTSFHDLMDYNFTAKFEDQLEKIAMGEMQWKEVLNNYYDAFKSDLLEAFEEDGMRPNPPTLTNIACPDCKIKNKSNKLRITNGSSGTFLGCEAYNYEGDEQCKKTLNLIHGDEAVSIDDQEEAEHLILKHRCPKCDTSMDNYLLDENHKLHICSNNPDCDGFEVEEGAFKIKGYDGPILSCHKCGSEMQLKTGRFGKYFGCMNDNCGTTRALQRNGEPKPIVMEPISTSIACSKFEDIYLLRDSMKGLFLAASKYPKNRETRAPSVEEFNEAVSEATLLDACKYLEDQGKHTHLLDAPKNDGKGNPYIIRYNKVEDTHYLASEKDGKKTGNTATHNGEQWIEVSK